MPMIIRSVARPLAAFTVMIAFTALPLMAQEESADRKFSVKAGIVDLDGVKYPVFTGVKEVKKSSIEGITFTITAKNKAAALALAKQIRAFYQGKRIGGFVVPHFKKVSKPDTVAWSAAKGTDEKGVLVCVKVEETSVTVYVIPSGSEGNLAHIL